MWDVSDELSEARAKHSTWVARQVAPAGELRVKDLATGYALPDRELVLIVREGLLDRFAIDIIERLLRTPVMETTNERTRHDAAAFLVAADGVTTKTGSRLEESSYPVREWLEGRRRDGTWPPSGDY